MLVFNIVTMLVAFVQNGYNIVPNTDPLVWICLSTLLITLLQTMFEFVVTTSLGMSTYKAHAQSFIFEHHKLRYGFQPQTSLPHCGDDTLDGNGDKKCYT